MQHIGYIWENGNTPGKLAIVKSRESYDEFLNLRIFFLRLVWHIPADLNNLVEVFFAVDGHRHVFICGHNLWIVTMCFLYL